MTPYYSNAGVTIYHGDCQEFLPGIGKVDLILTDPPYAYGAAKDEWRVTSSVAIGLNLAAKTVVDKGAMLVFAASSGRSIGFTLESVGKTLRFNRVLTWHKATVRSQVAGPWHWDTVQILAFGRASFGVAHNSSMFESEGSTCKRAPGETKHPAELPEGIAEWLFTPFAENVETILDPFCGTAQLLIPAVRAGKKVIGIDADERWCEVAAKRLALVAEESIQAAS